MVNPAPHLVGFGLEVILLAVIDEKHWPMIELMETLANDGQMMKNIGQLMKNK